MVLKEANIPFWETLFKERYFLAGALKVL